MSGKHPASGAHSPRWLGACGQVSDSLTLVFYADLREDGEKLGRVIPGNVVGLGTLAGRAWVLESPAGGAEVAQAEGLRSVHGPAIPAAFVRPEQALDADFSLYVLTCVAHQAACFQCSQHP